MLSGALYLRPSRQLQLLYISLYATTAIIVLLSMAPWWLKVGVCTLICAMGYRGFHRKISLRSRDAINCIVAKKDHLWQLGFVSGDVCIANLQGDSFLSRQLMLLNFSCSARRRSLSVVIVPAMLEGENFRRLLVHCRVSNLS